ncbi:MAG: methylmalonyl Co-A mutase-associated GTPase MeaB [Anaerolineae bacterium]|nr:methylmalonyl Co-A mutase-associated GTPase MeaB [Anaerolineae bacterium]
MVRAIRASRRELARLITRIENHAAGDDLAALYPFTGRAHVIGVTGAPGTGKSSLVNALARHFRSQNLTIGIIAVDPTSPFSGGAVLGDRIRMRDLAGDPGVFIRSMATRGSLGGLARATGDVVRALDAAGFDRVLIETVGAGQSEVDIAGAAHTTLVIEAPGLGDDVQAIKAGILEIADILVVNKADRPGVELTVRALRAMLDLGHRTERIAHHGQIMELPLALPTTNPQVDEASAWQTPVVQTIATSGDGIPDLADRIAAHREYLVNSGTLALRERRRVALELAERLREALLARLLAQADPAALSALVDRVLRREIDPASAAQSLLESG